jgi:hypothetical protein
MRVAIMSRTDTTMADGAVGITSGQDAVPITATIIVGAVTHPHTVRRQPAGPLLRCRMLREAGAANRTHFSSGLRTPF